MINIPPLAVFIRFDSLPKKVKEIKNLVKKTRKRADPNKMGTETATWSILEKSEETRR